MKKYIYYIICLTVVDVLVSVFVSTQLITLQQNYTSLREREKELQKTNTVLAREVAHMSSLQKVSKSAQYLGLTKTGNRIVRIEKDVYAALR